MAWLNFTVPGTTERTMRVNNATYAIEVRDNGEWVSCYKLGLRVTPGVVASVDETAGSCRVKENVDTATTVVRFYRLKTPVAGEAGLMIDSVFLPAGIFPSGETPSGDSLPAILNIPIPPDADADALHLTVEFSDRPDFSTVSGRINTTQKRDGVYWFVGGQVGQYRAFPVGGIGLEGYKSDVMIDLATAGIAYTFFIRYRWYDGQDYSAWKGVC